MKRCWFLLGQAVHSLLQTRLRSVLSVLGVMAGAAAIIALVNISYNSREAVLRQYDGLGYRMTTMTIGVQGQFNSLQAAANIARSLAAYEEVKHVFYYWGGNHKAELLGRPVDTSLLGIPIELQPVMRLSPLSGTLLNDQPYSDQTLVLGHSVYGSLLGQGVAPVPGDTIVINERLLKISGIARPSMATEVFSPDYSIMVNRDDIDQLDIAISYVGLIVLRDKGVEYRLIENMLEEFASTSFLNAEVLISSPESIIKSASEQSRMFQILTVVLGLVSLVVGGVGIMNIMLVSVSERTSEIGVRLSIGAAPHDIRLQFLFEAIMLCLVGGLLGIILAAIITFVHTQSMGWPFTFSTFSVLVGSFACSVTGLLFGYAPASMAAKLDPVKALSRA